MSAAEISRRIALPGDVDLDLDVDGLTITAVVVTAETQEILVRLADGFGRFRDSQTSQFVDFPPGDPNSSVRNVEVRMQFPDLAPVAFTAYVGRLQRWRDSGTPLRMCAAPGRITTLIADRDQYLFIPRRIDPGWL